MNGDNEDARLQAFQVARSEKPDVDPDAALRWVQAAFDRERAKGQKTASQPSRSKQELKDLYTQLRHNSVNTGKDKGLLLDSGHTWLGRSFLDVPGLMSAFGHFPIALTAAAHQFTSLVANPLAAGAGRSLTNVLVGMQADTPDFAQNIKSANNLSSIIGDMYSSRQAMISQNSKLKDIRNALIEQKSANSHQRVEALRSYLMQNSDKSQNSPIIKAVIKADLDQKKYSSRMAIADMNLQSRRHTILVLILDGIASGVSFAKGALLGSGITKLLLNPFYIISGHFDFKTKKEIMDYYNSKYANVVKEESQHKPISDLTKDDIDLSKFPHYRSKADTRAFFMKIIAVEDLGNSLRKLYILQQKLDAETREEPRGTLQSRIKNIETKREIDKNDLKILESKRDYNSLSPDGKIRKCILNDGFYVKEATLALLKSPGVLAGDILQRETTSLGTMGYGHDLSTAHDITKFADALGPDGSAATTATEEAATALSTASQRDYKGTTFKPLPMPAPRVNAPTSSKLSNEGNLGEEPQSPSESSTEFRATLNSQVASHAQSLLPDTKISDKSRRDRPVQAPPNKPPRSHIGVSQRQPLSLVPWPEEVSAKSSAAYTSRYSFRERLLHNVKGLGRFAAAVPVFVYQGRRAKTERKKLRSEIAKMHESIQWFAGKQVENGNKAPAVLADEIKKDHQEIYNALSASAASNATPTPPSGRFIPNAIPPRTFSRPSLSHGGVGR